MILTIKINYFCRGQNREIPLGGEPKGIIMVISEVVSESVVDFNSESPRFAHIVV